MAEIGTFVNEQTDNNYGNKVKESEITSVDYLVRDDRDVLSVEVRTVVTELLYLAPEIPENGENRESEVVKTDYYYFPLEG